MAKEHHELEQSLVSQVASDYRHKTKSPRFYDTSDDEFYDAFEAGKNNISKKFYLNFPKMEKQKPIRENFKKVVLCNAFYQKKNYFVDSCSDTLVTAGSPCDDTVSIFSAFSRSSSSSTLVSYGENSFMSAKDAPPMVQKKCWTHPNR